jgi:LuxR family maltose regulon positive regulatory protein
VYNGGSINRQIAQQLSVAEGTIRSHMTHILEKLQATNRTEAVYKVRLLGII